MKSQVALLLLPLLLTSCPTDASGGLNNDLKNISNAKRDDQQVDPSKYPIGTCVRESNVCIMDASTATTCNKYHVCKRTGDECGSMPESNHSPICNMKRHIEWMGFTNYDSKKELNAEKSHEGSQDPPETWHQGHVKVKQIRAERCKEQKVCFKKHLIKQDRCEARVMAKYEKIEKERSEKKQVAKERLMQKDNNCLAAGLKLWQCWQDDKLDYDLPELVK